MIVSNLNHPMLLAVILYLLAASVRIGFGLERSVFQQDQARDALLMEQYRDSGNWLIAYGPKASVGNFYLPPFYYQVHYIASHFSGFKPLTMQWVVIVVESATPVVLFLILSRYLSPTAAGTLAVGYLFSTLPFTFGTSAWNPNMIPFFSSLSLYSWLKILEDKQPSWTIIGIVSVAIACSLHYQSVVLLPLTALVFLLHLRMGLKLWKWWAIGSILASMLLLPYVMQEIQNNWSNTRNIIAYFTQEHSQYFDRVSKPQYVVTFLPAFMERVLIGVNAEYLLVGRVLVAFGIVSGVVIGLKNRTVRILFLYCITIFVALRFYKGDKLDYYLSTLFIAPILFFSFVVKLFSRYLLVILLVLLAFSFQYLLVLPPENGVKKLEHLITTIDKYVDDSSASLLFDDGNSINYFVYGFNRFSAISLESSSKTLIQICKDELNCTNSYPLSCSLSRTRTYAALQKETGQYEYSIGLRNVEGYRISIGQTKRPLTKLGYPLFNMDYGSDYLLNGVHFE